MTLTYGRQAALELGNDLLLRSEKHRAAWQRSSIGHWRFQSCAVHDILLDHQLWHAADLVTMPR